MTNGCNKLAAMTPEARKKLLAETREKNEKNAALLPKGREALPTLPLSALFGGRPID
jgi:hypothetical protein